MTVYAIGDIHGHLGLLHAAHARIEADRARTGAIEAPVVHIGDLVDRGPNSAGVVEYLYQEMKQDPRIVVLRGNHDHVFLRWLNGQDEREPGARRHPPWLDDRMGGKQTLASYGLAPKTPAADLRVSAQTAVPARHRAYLSALPYSFAAGDCLFVHAGVRPEVAIEDQAPVDLIWIREEFLLARQSHGPLVVHGHTPSETVEHHGNRLGIDTGAAYGGPLSAVAIEGRTAYLLTLTERVPVADFS